MARRLRQLDGVDVGEIRGIGAKRVEALAEVDVHTVLDLITYYPRTWIDRTRQVDISDLKEDEEALVMGQVKRSTSRRTRSGRTIAEIHIFDGSSYLKCVFFNQGWRARQLQVGTNVVVFGKVERYQGRRQMNNPLVDLVGDRTGRIVPVYPASEKAGIVSWEVADWIEEALERAGELVDPVPEEFRDRLDLAPRTWAIKQIHAPNP